MNKARIDQLIPYAYKAIETCGISEGGKVQKSFRGQISTFGAAVSMGSLIAAIAFFSDRGEALADRSKLPAAILDVLHNAGIVPQQEDKLYSWAEKEISQGRESSCREEILNAAIAIKLAMNLYQLIK